MTLTIHGSPDQRQLTWLDLCSGLGGASQPALDRGWRVIRVDIERRFRPDVVADARAFPFRPFWTDLFWISLPCDGFARASLPWKKEFGSKPSVELAL